jgi:hypothetical protein
MEKNCEKKCEGCPVVREWAEEVDEVEYDTTFLGEALMGSQMDMDKAIKAYTEIAGQEAVLGVNWNRFVSAQRQMDYSPQEFRKLGSELLERLQEQGDSLREEISEAQEDCPGLFEFELETPTHKIIGKMCMSPVFRMTDGIEPVHIQRIPKSA